MMSLDQYLTVTALTKYIKAKLEGDKHLFSILLKGEVSNFKKHSRGHFYFTLKDEGAQISAIMFSSYTSNVNFNPKEGDHVLVKGKISLYEPSGSYSIQVSEMTLDGIGELYLKYEALKKDLEAKGYFDQSHKREIPKYPKVIGVVTSPTGAVIEDIKNTVSRRYLLTEIHLYPALVQGPDSSISIKRQIERANRLNEVDVLIVGRGGGSIEDLWGFNEMPAIEAIYQSKIPVITAIGHETDFTISDFVSDLRAPTPTAAAELATPNQQDILMWIKEQKNQMTYRVKSILDRGKTSLVHLDERLDLISPKNKFIDLQQRMFDVNKSLLRNYVNILDFHSYRLKLKTDRLKSPEDKIKELFEKHQRLEKNLKDLYLNTLDKKTHQFQLINQTMQNLNPLSLMDRGYAVVLKDEKIMTSIHDVEINEHVDIRLKDGRLQAKITGKKA
jgi:exodeoxyribonuclease VII large subunit